VHWWCARNSSSSGSSSSSGGGSDARTHARSATARHSCVALTPAPLPGVCWHAAAPLNPTHARR
jgi:hypothetical protein